MSELQYESIDGKIKQTFNKRGQAYTRKGFDIRVDTATKFARKCQLMGYSETKIVEMLVEAFCQSSGWGTEVKSGAYFEKSPKFHIVEANQSVGKNLFPWDLNN